MPSDSIIATFVNSVPRLALGADVGRAPPDLIPIAIKNNAFPEVLGGGAPASPRRRTRRGASGLRRKCFA
eukprot:2687548-Pyramimonas_sp.AAC.1